MGVRGGASRREAAQWIVLGLYEASREEAARKEGRRKAFLGAAEAAP
jgi:hypothetical protein